MLTITPEALARQYGLPAYNVAGDPLVLCRTDHGANVPIYAVADLGADRDLCAACREAKATEGTTSVMDLPGRPADSRETRRQIGFNTLMSCGARDFVRDDNGLLMFRVGPNGKRVCKVLIRLRPDDTYAVEYGRMQTSNPFRDDFGVWQVIEQEHGVYAEQLPAVVRALGDRDRY